LKSRTSWREKPGRPQEAKLVKIPPKMARFGKGMTRYLRSEGFAIGKAGKKLPAVKTFEDRLFRFDL
jgi:hypothetical protein